MQTATFTTAATYPAEPQIGPSPAGVRLDLITSAAITLLMVRGSHGQLEHVGEFTAQQSVQIPGCTGAFVKDAVAGTHAAVQAILFETKDPLPGYVAAGATQVQSPVIASAFNQLAADVTMTLANTYYDGPTVTLGAGTWYLSGSLTVTRGASAGELTGVIWDKAAIIVASNGMSSRGINNGDAVTLAVSGLITLAASTALYFSAACDATTHTIRAAAPVNSKGNTASSLAAIQLA